MFHIVQTDKNPTSCQMESYSINTVLIHIKLQSNYCIFALKLSIYKLFLVHNSRQTHDECNSESAFIISFMYKSDFCWYSYEFPLKKIKNIDVAPICCWLQLLVKSTWEWIRNGKEGFLCKKVIWSTYHLEMT